MDHVNKDITVMLIDDEQASIDILELYLSEIEGINIVCKVTDPVDISPLFQENFPDIVFLDIDMKDFDGLEIAKAIKNDSPDTEIIFATGHPEYAFRALKIKPLSYLVKPFGPDSIKDVISRYRDKVVKIRLEQYMESLLHKSTSYKKIKLPIIGGIVLVDPNDIMVFKSELNRCRIYLKGGENELITRSTLQLLKIVNMQAVAKTNKSTYINIKYLSKIERKNKVCIVEYGDNILTTNIIQSNIAQLEKMITSLSPGKAE